MMNNCMNIAFELLYEYSVAMHQLYSLHYLHNVYVWLLTQEIQQARRADLLVR